ncbi:peptidase inhibitor family I36 protein [Streptomyces sp. NPDC020917]|uniref:peptidase inhibitor family I36 protein n=1 Tax=Streptomyces sp. NPDC020917 TaxID=3365102 RepID=UPI00378FAE9A
MLRSRIAALFGATALLAVLPVAQAHAAATTADGISMCPSGYACFWANSNYDSGSSAHMGKVQGDNPDFSALFSSNILSCGYNWDECISSIANHGTQCTVYFYSDHNYGKTHSWHSLSRGDEVSSFASGYNDPNFNDSISSNKWCNS